MDSSKTLVKMVGRGTTQAMKRVDTSATTAKVISILAGAIAGGVLGKMYPTAFMGGDLSPVTGAAVGGTAGWATAEIAEALGAFKANMETASDDDIKDHFESTPISAFVIPGYSTYYQQQLRNKATTDKLLKSAAVLSIDEIKAIRQKAKDWNLDGREILDDYDDEQIQSLANGIGPNTFNESVVKGINTIAPYAVPAAVIHDLDWARGHDNKKLFEESNTRFRDNINKGIRQGMSWYNPMRYVALLNSGFLKAMVDTNYKHYREGEQSLYDKYLSLKDKLVNDAIQSDEYLSRPDVNTDTAKYKKLLAKIQKAKDKIALHDSGYFKRPAVA